MTKKILLATIVATFTFSGCVSSDPTPTADKAVKATSKAVKVTEKVAKSVDKATKDSAESKLPQSSLSDEVVDDVVEVVDKKTDGTATKIIESVK